MSTIKTTARALRPGDRLKAYVGGRHNPAIDSRWGGVITELEVEPGSRETSAVLVSFEDRQGRLRLDAGQGLLIDRDA